jgi:Na+/phosphate symporter
VLASLAFFAVYVRVAGMASETFKKRQKELARQQKQKEKAFRRMQRKEEKLHAQPRAEGEDPDIAWIVPGPQPKNDD